LLAQMSLGWLMQENSFKTIPNGNSKLLHGKDAYQYFHPYDNIHP